MTIYTGDHLLLPKTLVTISNSIHLLHLLSELSTPLLTPYYPTLHPTTLSQICFFPHLQPVLHQVLQLPIPKSLLISRLLHYHNKYYYHNHTTTTTLQPLSPTNGETLQLLFLPLWVNPPYSWSTWRAEEITRQCTEDWHH